MKPSNRVALAAMVAEANANPPPLDTDFPPTNLSLARKVARDTHPLHTPIVPAVTVEGEPDPKLIQNVPLHLIQPNPFNARRIYRAELEAQLAKSILAHGQELPGLATIRDGKYTLSAGHRRLKALQSIGATHMALIVQPDLSDHQLYEQSYRENSEREAPTAIDNALCWSEMLANGTYAEALDIATAIGVSASVVSQTISILKLSEIVLDEVKNAPCEIPFSVLYEIYLHEQIKGFEETLEITRKYIRGEISRAGIRQDRQSHETPKPRKSKESFRTHIIKQNGIQIGSIKERDSGTIIIQLNLTDETQRASLVNEIRDRFSMLGEPPTVDD